MYLEISCHHLLCAGQPEEDEILGRKAGLSSGAASIPLGRRRLGAKGLSESFGQVNTFNLVLGGKQAQGRWEQICQLTGILPANIFGRGVVRDP